MNTTNGMTGIYIHIPFCRQACRYCDFYFTVSLKNSDPFLGALKQEIRMRGEGLKGKKVSTLYLGGGTPTILTDWQLNALLELLRDSFELSPDAEITIEANPDDLSKSYLQQLKRAGFNRLSIGIQSFFDEDLSVMRRSHNAVQAKRSVEDAFQAGFTNLTIDLIYGMPGLTNERWQTNLATAFDLPIQHLSAYHLTFEQGTVFDHWRKKGKIEPVREALSLEQYKILREEADKKGFLHYEISNFSKEGYHSRHNMIYWNRKTYIGLGPSAHSFDGRIRRWNVASLKKYISAIDSGEVFYEEEIPNEKERYHDYIITSLRTREGLDRQFMDTNFGDRIRNHFDIVSSQFLRNGKMVREGNHIRLTPESWFISEYVMRELFMD